MAAFSSGINLRTVVGELEDLKADRLMVWQRIQKAIDDAVRETATEFRQEVINQIEQSEIETRSGELINSWKVRPKGEARYEVRSTADHAVFLEVGTGRHTIEGSPWLMFRPSSENLPKYPERNFSEEDGNVTGDVKQNGLIVSEHDPLASGGGLGSYVAKRVNHPGNKSYGYFDAALDEKQWGQTLSNKIRVKVNKVLDEFEAS